jgi:hypothetical protein
MFRKTPTVLRKFERLEHTAYLLLLRRADTVCRFNFQLDPDF